ncbi:MAG: hypothetical protein A2X12_08405 [Bacteroidetes bacterium GWE2_29_8]|nr:MAG: hypothetical protein A2X12_08405 [Bacteroidetes bacterium GWE2_29_8]OFY15899.1 MAG: hypothetical protein A2X02_04870 [Bacteroidetes bacterium GWF2_29_10]
MNRLYKLLFFIILCSILFACSKKDNKDNEIPLVNNSAKLKITFSHYCNGKPVVYDSMMYYNKAGNKYEITEIQYFISDVVLYKNGQKQITINQWNDIYYIDTNLPETFVWEVFDQISPDNYDSIAFTFGINKAKNISFMFVNPPERDMFWPEVLGGGYHYLKLNGFWENIESQRKVFNFHLGPGQIYTSENTTEVDSIIGFVDNSFFVSLKNSYITFEAGQTTEINIRMNVEKWFEYPTIFDFNIHESNMMQKQSSMKIASENGQYAFELTKM